MLKLIFSLIQDKKEDIYQLLLIKNQMDDKCYHFCR